MPEAAAFPATRWSQVVEAGSGGALALDGLCRDYWRPLYAFARRRGLRPADAEDAVQAFFARLLAGDGIARADRRRGRFRSFLLAAFRNHLADAHDHATAACRDRGRLVWLDAADAEARLALEPAAAPAGEAAFDRDWALLVLEGVRQDLAAEYRALGHERTFTALEPWLAAPGTPADTVAAALGSTPGAAKVALHRLRQRWRDLLRARIADTVGDPADIDDELRHLAAAAQSL